MNLTTKKRLLLTTVYSASVLALAACGGSGGGDDDTPGGPAATLEGMVIDGALGNAKVCLDVNENRVCDADEPSAATAANGSFKLEAPEDLLAAHTVLAVAAAGTTTDADYGPVKKSYTLAAPAGKGALISPFTTLLQSELDGGRSANLAQAEITLSNRLVGTAGDTGGLTVYSNYLPLPAEANDAYAAKRARMYGIGQILTRGFAETAETSGLTGKAGFGALGLVATGSLQQLASQVSASLTEAQRDVLFASIKDSLVPTPATLATVAALATKTQAAPIEGAWTGTKTLPTGETVTELYVFLPDGAYMHRVITTSSTTSTLFDNGFGARYGRYTFANGTLTTTVLDAAEVSGPQAGALTGVTLNGDQLTGAGLNLSRVSSASGVVGAWVRPDGSAEPEVLVMFGDGTFVHSTFYSQHDPATGTAPALETARYPGMRKGTYAQAVPASGSPAPAQPVFEFGETPTVAFNGALAVPSTPGVASLQADGSLSMTGLRMVKLGTAASAKAYSGLNEATRSRIWSGRFFSRTVNPGTGNRTQYLYVRGPNDVMTFWQAPTGSSATVACDISSTNGAVLPFTQVDPSDGLLKQFVVGTGTAASAGAAQRRLNVGVPGTVTTFTPAGRPTDATARCAVPL